MFWQKVTLENTCEAVFCFIECLITTILFAFFKFKIMRQSNVNIFINNANFSNYGIFCLFVQWPEIVSNDDCVHRNMRCSFHNDVAPFYYIRSKIGFYIRDFVCSYLRVVRPWVMKSGFLRKSWGFFCILVATIVLTLCDFMLYAIQLSYLVL